ncbi:mucin-17-like isoform X2 [Pungitius pungitius]|uniref:mucin-17-like isoform X2 n=1 Tax=Pungitius pungitius TaxID=134920 RepID=UPI002E0F8F7D
MNSWKMSSQLSLNVPDESVCWLHEECLPEVTFLDVTCSSPHPAGVPATPATPATTGSANSRLNSLQAPQSSSSIDLNTTSQLPCPQKERPDLLQWCLSRPNAASGTLGAKPSRQNGTKTLSETSSSDVAQETHSEFHSSELSVSYDKMVDPLESMYRPERFMDSRYFPEITLLDVTRESEPTDGGESSFMEVPQENILESSRTSPEHSGSNEVMVQPSGDNTFNAHPSNVTQDLSSSSVVTVQCTASESSASDTQCDTSSKNVTSELHGEPPGTSTPVEANDEEPLSRHEAELTSKETQPSPETCGSVSSPLNSLQSSHSSSSTNLNTTTTTLPGPRNTTLDLTPSNASSPKAESEPTDRATPLSTNTTETSLCVNRTFPAVKAPGSSDMQTSISLRTSCGNTFIGKAGSGTFCLQNNTFDAKPPKQNDTVTLSEASSNDGLQNTFDKATPPGVRNSTSTPKESSCKAQPPERDGTPSSTVPDTKIVDTPECVSEADPAVEVASGADQCETTRRSRPSLPLTSRLSDTFGCQTMETENKSEHPFNLDESLDLRADILITSTPMTTCKILSVTTERAEGKTIAAQKRLCGEGPAGLPHGPKSLLPPSRTASQLLRQKSGSALSGRFDASTSGLPMTRQRTQAEALKNAAQATGVSSAYKLRASTTGLKVPNSGLPRPQLSGIPSGIQRPAAGLRPPSARSNASSSSHVNRPRGPTAANPVTKATHSKKQPLSRGEPLPIAKKKRMDAASGVSASDGSAAEVSACSDAVGRHRALKQPATSHPAVPARGKGHECATCVMLKQQLQQKSEEIQRLKEELLKKS